MRAFVEQIENGLAELRLGEDEASRVALPLSALPAGLREGEVLTLSFARDEAATRAAAAENDALRQKLLERSQDEPF